MATVNVPYRQTIPAKFLDTLRNGNLDVTVRGRVEDIENAIQQFRISFADNLDDNKADNVPFSFEVGFCPDPCEGTTTKTAYRRYRMNGSDWLDICPPSSPLKIDEGTDFTIVISVKGTGIGTTVNGAALDDCKRMVDFSTTNSLVITGDHLKLYEPGFMVRLQ